MTSIMGLLERSPSERKMVETLILIANSYEWEPYEDDETIVKLEIWEHVDYHRMGDNHEITGREDTGRSTNRRLARELLAELMIEFEGKA